MSGSYNFTYTVIVPTTAGGSTGGNFGFTTGTTQAVAANPGDVDFTVTGFSGDFNDSQIVSASGITGTGPDFVDGVNASGVTFTTASGESVRLYNNNGVLSIIATGPTPINGPVSAESYNTTAPACFLRGTLIMTASGEIPVEELAIGDMLVTGGGAIRPIKWMGRRTYAGRLAATTMAVQPVCISAGALGNNLPKRDLRVSAKHAMLLDGVLVAAEDLVNGSNVVRESGHTEIEYYHMEFSTHDVVLAEGCLSESFTDDDNRAIFHNASEYRALYPQEVSVPAQYCAPRVVDGPLLHSIRASVAGLPQALAA